MEHQTEPLTTYGLTEQDMEDAGCYKNLCDHVFKVMSDNGVTLVRSEIDGIITNLIMPAYFKGAYQANCFISPDDVTKMFSKYEGKL